MAVSGGTTLASSFILGGEERQAGLLIVSLKAGWKNACSNGLLEVIPRAILDEKNDVDLVLDGRLELLRANGPRYGGCGCEWAGRRVRAPGMHGGSMRDQTEGPHGL